MKVNVIGICEGEELEMNLTKTLKLRALLATPFPSMFIHTANEIKGSRNVYDVVIVGGGMVGTTMACKLGHDKRLSTKRILLLEGSPKKEWQLTPHYSNRVSALNGGTKSLLESIGAWEKISKARCKAVKKMQIWDALSDAMITFNHDEMTEEIAYIVENDLLVDTVSKCLEESTSNVEVIYNAKVKNCKIPSSDVLSGAHDLAQIEMEDGTSYSCRLLIGADGANSKIRKAMGTQYVSWNYDQMGIVGTLRLSEPMDNVVAWQRFLPTGPIALLPLTDELSSLVWTVGKEEAKLLLRLPNENFVDAVNEVLWKQYPRDSLTESANKIINSLLETINLNSNAIRQLPPSVSGVLDGSRAAFPLGFGHAARYVSPRTALVGDAAHRVHPLAGQGVNLGFGDVQCLAEIVGTTVHLGAEIGNMHSLHEYETLRQRHNIPTMMVIDALQKLYGSSMKPVVVLRSVGLQFTHALNPIKKFIMGHAAV